MKKWKVAIMGCGMIAQEIYIPQMRRIEKAELVAVCIDITDRYQFCFLNAPH